MISIFLAKFCLIYTQDCTCGIFFQKQNGSTVSSLYNSGVYIIKPDSDFLITYSMINTITNSMNFWFILKIITSPHRINNYSIFSLNYYFVLICCFVLKKIKLFLLPIIVEFILFFKSCGD